jgi:ATP-dependent DNA helicase RecQ
MIKGGTRRAERIAAVARERFGIAELRPPQETAIAALLRKRDCLAVMPTGSGKSAIYQLAGLELSGLTVVVSPLLALQRDQLDALHEAGVEEAAALNSDLSEGQQEEVVRRGAAGELRFLFTTPEQLAEGELVKRLGDADVSLFVVDEAHCVSGWGHDFRPDYLQLAPAARGLGRPPILALTATASSSVREDIVERLGMGDVELVVTGFDRPNLLLAVEPARDEAHKRRLLYDAVEGTDPPGIVYAATRGAAEEIARELSERGIRALAYHAGLGRRQRREQQDAFMEDRAEVMVATIAFGMGIDKPNVRFVFHDAPSESLDAYHQEIGRGGRAGEPALATLFYRSEDLGLRRYFAASGRIGRAELQRLAQAIGNRPLTSEEELRSASRMGPRKLKLALSRLEQAAAIRREASGMIRRLLDGDPVAMVDEAVALGERHAALERSRVEMMRGYAETRDCRRAYLLSYFGEPFTPPCGSCDNCILGIAEKEPKREPIPFAINTAVRHSRWGEGTVTRYEDERVVVLFDSVGYKALLTERAVRRGTLRAAG